MDKAKVEPVVLPDVYDPTVPISDLIPLIPSDNPADDQPQPSEATGHRQPQKQPQTEPLEPGTDTDIGGEN